MSNKLSPLEQRLLKTKAVRISVLIHDPQTHTRLYCLEDGHPHDRFNTIRARSPEEAITKILSRYLNERKQLNFRLEQAKKRAAWNNARSPLPATNRTEHFQHKENYWTKKSQEHHERFKQFAETLSLQEEEK